MQLFKNWRLLGRTGIGNSRIRWMVLCGAVVGVGCSYTTMPSDRRVTGVVIRDALEAGDSTDLVATIRRLRPSWLVQDDRDLQILVDRMPVPLDTILALSPSSVNQIMYHDPASARRAFATAQGEYVIEVVTVLGSSTRRGAWKSTPWPRIPLRMETRVGVSWGWQHFDSLTAPAVEASIVAASDGYFGVAAGVHASNQQFQRGFRDGMVANPTLKLRYWFVEPRFFFGYSPAPASRPYVGVRIIVASWRVRAAHPDDPRPLESAATEMGLGFVAGMTVVRWKRLWFDLSVDYVDLPMDLQSVHSNPVYRLDQPVRAGGKLWKFKGGIMYRW